MMGVASHKATSEIEISSDEDDLCVATVRFGHTGQNMLSADTWWRSDPHAFGGQGESSADCGRWSSRIGAAIAHRFCEEGGRGAVVDLDGRRVEAVPL